MTIKFIENSITDAEKAELVAFLNESEVHMRRFKKRITKENLLEKFAALQEAVDQQAVRKESKKGKLIKLYGPRLRRLSSVAAAGIVMFATGLWLHRVSYPIPKTELQSNLKADLAPGGNKAILTLSDGSRVSLDSAAKGTLATQGVTKILKEKDGQLAYRQEGKAVEMLYNTISTPAGGTYQVTLPDGSKVWLNASSFIRFPTSFSGSYREVEIKGEAYFEITADPQMPFRVVSKGMVINVLGTHFNVNAYEDEESIKTTLVQGSVRISTKDNNLLLKPGQQAKVENQQISQSTVNIDEIIAWKNGFFEFNDAEIQTVMKALSRWYNVKVEYSGKINSDLLTAKIRRNNYASDVLQILEASGYHFQIKGKTIIVLP